MDTHSVSSVPIFVQNGHTETAGDLKSVMVPLVELTFFKNSFLHWSSHTWYAGKLTIYCSNPFKSRNLVPTCPRMLKNPIISISIPIAPVATSHQNALSTLQPRHCCVGEQLLYPIVHRPSSVTNPTRPTPNGCCS